MKRKIALSLAIMIMLFAVGCSNNDDSGYSSLYKETNSSNSSDNAEVIYDNNNNEIGNIKAGGLISIIGDKLFFSDTSAGSADGLANMDYYLLDIPSKGLLKLGTIDNYIYESSYDRVLVDDHLYTLVTTGNTKDKSSWELDLMDFDLKNGSVKTLSSEQDSNLYNTMDILDDDLLIVKRDRAGKILTRYSISDNSFKTLKEYRLDSSTGIGDTVRHICTDNGTISLLRVNSETRNSFKLFLDRYDKNMELLSSENISDIFGDEKDEEAQNELRQIVFDLYCHNDILYYENQSITRFLVKTDQVKAVPLIDMNVNEEFLSAKTLYKSAPYRLFYKPFGTKNTIYILNAESGEVTEKTFSVDNDDRYCIGSVFQSDEKILIKMVDRIANASDKKEPKSYFISIEELFGRK